MTFVTSRRTSGFRMSGTKYESSTARPGCRRATRAYNSLPTVGRRNACANAAANPGTNAPT